MTDPDAKRAQTQLLRDAAGFQIKTLISALRDLVLSPISIAAAALDLLLSRTRKPTLFYTVLRWGDRSEHLIDLWSAATRDETGSRAGDASPNVDWVLDKVEALVRDPKSGKKDALVLKRWAQIRLASAARKSVRQLPAEKEPRDP